MNININNKGIKLKDVMDSPCGLRYMFDTLDLCSGYSRKLLLNSDIMTDSRDVINYYSSLEEIYTKYCSIGPKRKIELLKNKFCNLKDILGTINRLSSNNILDDIELFEIKSLALLTNDVRTILLNDEIQSVKLPDLDDVISVLDPDGFKICSFYVYDSYSEELRNLRIRIKQSNNSSEKQELELQEKDLECKVRKDICAKLILHTKELYDSLMTLGQLDVLIAKAQQIASMHLIFPLISENDYTSYRGLFHPQIKVNKEFIPIDIDFDNRPVIITGSNMGGKTVTLMMCALSQYLFQFGFGIPAEYASIAIKEKIYLIMGDGQNIYGGYSSFAAEMISINSIIQGAKRGEKLIAIIDEPARTTNPIEGRALVQGLLDTLYKYHIFVLVSTHYNINEGEYKWLRVKGFVDGKMDYRLIEAKRGEVPHEAVKIAKNLGVCEEWLELSEQYINN